MSVGAVHVAFGAEVLDLPLTAILPLRQLAANVARSSKYQRVVTSIAEVGVIEPLAVARPNANGQHLLLDGHLRYYALLERGEPSASCIVADDDEAFTYNKRVNRLATVQEHYMIKRAIERGGPRSASRAR